MTRRRQVWQWGLVALVVLCTLALIALYMSAVLDKEVGAAGKIVLLVIAGVGIVTTFVAGGNVIEPGKGVAGLATPKAASLAFAAVIVTFGLMSDVYGFLQPRPAVESEAGKIEATTDAILSAVTAEGKATPEERLAWQSLAPDNCDALRGHIERFPDGGYAQQAAARLSASRKVETEVWTPETRSLPLRVSEAAAEASEAAARAAALDRGRAEAETLCNGFAATSLYRAREASVTATNWTCSQASGGHVCGFAGQAICALDVRGVVLRETCGAAQ